MTRDKLEKLNRLNERIKKLTEQIEDLKELLSDKDNIYSNSFVVNGRVKNNSKQLSLLSCEKQFRMLYMYALKKYEITLAQLQKEFDEL